MLDDPLERQATGRMLSSSAMSHVIADAAIDTLGRRPSKWLGFSSLQLCCSRPVELAVGRPSALMLSQPIDKGRRGRYKAIYGPNRKGSVGQIHHPALQAKCA